MLDWAGASPFAEHGIRGWETDEVDPRALVALNRCGISYEPSRYSMSSLALTKRRPQEKLSLVLSLLPRGLARSIHRIFLPI